MLRLDPTTPSGQEEPASAGGAQTRSLQPPGKRSGRWPRKRWLGLGALALLGFAAALPGPPAAGTEGTLADGTRLRLEAVTRGSDQRFPLEPPVRAWFRERVPWLAGWLRAPEQAHLSGSPTDLTAWVTRRSADGHAVEAEWDAGAVEILDLHGCPYETTSGTNYTLTRSTVGFVEINNYPRRAERLRLRVAQADGKPAVELLVPVPRPPAFPTWKTQALPFTQSIGGSKELRLTLEKARLLRVERDGVPGGWTPTGVARFRVERNGRTEPGWETWVEEISDASGNSYYPGFQGTANAAEACWFTAPCFQEPAWRLQVRPIRSDRAAFGPKEKVFLGRLALPKPGELHRLDREFTWPGFPRLKIHLRAVMGAGKAEFAYQDAQPVKLGKGLPAFPFQTEARLSPSQGAAPQFGPDGNRWWVQGRSPILALSVRGLADGQHLTLLAQDPHGSRISLGSYGTLSGPQDHGVFIPLPLLPEDGPLTLSLAAHRSQPLQVTFRPPQPEPYPQWDVSEGPDLPRRVREAERFMAEFPHESSLMNNLAWLLATGPKQFRNLERAVQLAERAVSIGTDDVLMRNTLGIAYLRAGRLRESRSALRLSETLWPEGANGHNLYALSQVEARLGNAAQARSYFQRAERYVKQNRASLDPQWRNELVMLRAEALPFLPPPTAQR